MNKSFFAEYIEKNFKGIVKAITEKINGKKEADRNFAMEFLMPEETLDMKWASLQVNSEISMVDVVAMDSTLPLGKRDSIERASGDIQKLGRKYSLGEREFKDIKVMEAMGGKTSSIVPMLFRDSKKGIEGIWQRLNFQLLQALSTGFYETTVGNNDGTEGRVTFPFKDSNKFGAETNWSDPVNSKPIDDIEKVMNKASEEDGNIITTLFMDKYSFDNLRKSTQAKEYYASYSGFAGSNIKVPSATQINDVLSQEFGIEVVVVRSTFKVEKNGKTTNVAAWNKGTIAFTTTKDLGTLTYASTAEEDSPVEGVSYEKSGDFILVSKYSKNDPFKEFTSVQALVVPVLKNVNDIYLLNTNEAQEVDASETEGDTTITIWGESLTKATVITALEGLDAEVASGITDADLIKLINNLSDEDEELLKDELGV